MQHDSCVLAASYKHLTTNIMQNNNLTQTSTSAVQSMLADDYFNNRKNAKKSPKHFVEAQTAENKKLNKRRAKNKSAKLSRKKNRQ